VRANAYAHRARPWFAHRRFSPGVVGATSAGRA